ncbi:hypothetical protein BV372_22480 [Nostoc sp. T09]|uniref:acyltransferase family protein n=1 Tax=Nostoc sp. T09 TaxID=1932621 RepID=UPI000A391660|nr:acyltransferase [Nostoc sp. T09]OUL29867.1 hypothetical protein BV372_22480 [Nostoc sp. T09]
MNISLALSSFLDFSRWVAAFVVVISHLRNLLFADYEIIENKNIAIRAFYFLTGFGHQAVIIFFVLSGFLIAGSIFSHLKANKFSLLRYFIDRFSRIYIVFPLSLITGLIFDLLGCSYFNGSGLYTNQINLATVGFNISERLGIDVFLSNLVMLQTITSPSLGSNGPLWSLANEWWYYFYFPLIILTFNYKSIYKKVLCLIGVAALSVMMYNSNIHGNMLIFFSVWMTGAAVWLFKTRKTLNFYAAITLMILYLIFLRIQAINFFTPFQQDFILGILFSVTIKSINESHKLFINMQTINKEIASFSFSLYLTHLPLSIFAIAVLSNFEIINLQMQPELSTFLTLFLLLTVTYSFAFFFALITEKNTLMIKKFIHKFIVKS